MVTTWSDIVVQARGRLRAVEDADWLRAPVMRMAEPHEAQRAQPRGIADAPPDYNATLLRHIVGIEITITDLVAKWKVSRNRGAAARQGVAAAQAACADRTGDSQAAAMTSDVAQCAAS